MELVGLVIVVAIVGVPIAALVVSAGAKRRAELLELKVDLLEKAGERLDQQLLALKREIRELREAISFAPAAERGASDARPTPSDACAVETTLVLPPLPPFAPAPPPPVAVEGPPPPPVQAASPGSVSPAPPWPEVEAPPPPREAFPPLPVPPPVFALEGPPGAPPPRPVEVPPVPVQPPAARRPAAPVRLPVPPAAKPAFDWEGLVGVKLFSWLAGICLVTGALYFLGYSIQQGWLSPPVRMAIGLATGVVLLVVCELKAARRYATTANALDGAAIAVLFSTFFAAHSLWKLLPVTGTFLALALVAAVAVALSIRRDSLFIALLGLLGGFATPALLSTGEDRPVGLFGYLLLLSLGLAWVARRKRWPVLSLLAMALSTVYQWAWVAKFLTAGKLPAAAAIFLVFPLLSFGTLAFGKRRDAGEEADGAERQFTLAASFSGLLPFAFAVYLAAVPAYGARFDLLFGFLFLLDLALFAVALWRGPALLHVAGAGSTLIVLAVWLGLSFTREAFPAVLGAVAGFVLFFLAAPSLAERLGARRSGPPLPRAPGDDLLDEPWSLAAIAAPLLLFAFPTLVYLEPRTEEPGLVFSVLFVLMAAISVRAVLRSEGPLHFFGAFFALAAEAVWSAKALVPGRLQAGLLLYGGFALFYLGVPLVAARIGRPLKPEGSGSVALFASLGLLLFLAAGPVAGTALWGLALLLGVLNAGLFFEGASGRLPIVTIAGIVFSWAILGIWWVTAPVGTMLLPALAVVAGFSLLTLGGSLWAGKKAAASGGGELFGTGLSLGLAGHAFLLFVASQPGLSEPPWPLLAILLVLDLALGVAALFVRRGHLFAAAMGASGLVLLVLEGTAGTAAWSRVDIGTALLLVGLAFAGMWAAGRRGRTGPEVPLAPFALAPALALLLGQCVAIVAAAHPPAGPPFAFLASAHLLFLVAAVALSWRTGWHVLPLLAMVPAWAAVNAWRTGAPGAAWGERLVFAAAVYAVFLAAPLLLGRRGEKLREPFLGAVLASVPFFFVARECLVGLGYGGVIGMLPVGQAALLSVHLVQLLRLEPDGRREPARLALVAGAVLAFVTVAIPLQLSNEWVTVGWALEGAALAWLFTRIPHPGLLASSAALLGAAFVRLVLNPAVLQYHERSATPIFNWYLYTYLVGAGSFFAAAWFLRRSDDEVAGTGLRVGTLCPPLGTILLFALVNIEVADYFATGRTVTFHLSRRSQGEDLTYTLAWALFAIALLAAGVLLRSYPARLSAIGLLLVTILKAFLHDLAHLTGLARVGSFVGLAISLALVALAIQRFVTKRPEEKA
jgi:hypothetical protein